MKKIIFLICIIGFIGLLSCKTNRHTVYIHKNSKVSYVGNGVGMIPDCNSHKKYSCKTYKRK